MKKKICAVLFIMMLAVCLAGCKQTYTVMVNDDNTVNFSIKEVVDKDTYSMISSFNINIQDLENNKMLGLSEELDETNALFQERAAFFQNRGYSIIPLEDSVEIGFEAKKSFMTLQEFNDEIKKLYDLGLCGLSLEVENNRTRTSNVYTAYGLLEYAIDKDINLEDESMANIAESQFDVSSMSSEAYIYMPPSVPVTATDGDQTVVNGSIYWTAEYLQNEPTEVHAYSEYKDTTIMYVGIIVGIVILVIVLIVASRLIKRKKEKEQSARNDESFQSDDF